MKITKFGHCCMLIEENGIRILTDPGIYSEAQNELNNIDIVLITHEHSDHFHIDSLKLILKNNPNVKIITNKVVGDLLTQAGINNFELVEEGQSYDKQGVLIEGYGTLHAEMHSEVPRSNNTGYFIANRLFYPGDALTNPNREIDILALPVGGPWIKVSEAVDYALSLSPKKCFPVHDGGLKNTGTTDRIPKIVLEPKGIEYLVFEIGKVYEL